MSERQRRYRRRQRQGIAVYRVAAGDRVIDALIAAGRLSEREAGDRDRIDAELSAVAAEWADRWTLK